MSGVSSNRLDHADDAIHRGANLVAHVGEEFALGFIRRCGGFRRLDQRQLVALPLGDVALRSGHRHGLPGSIAFQSGANSIPAPLAGVRFAAHFHVHENVFSNTLLDGIAQLRLVFDMNDIEEFLADAQEFTLRKPEQFSEVRRHPHFARRHIQFPQTVVGAAYRASEARLGVAQLLLRRLALRFALIVIKSESDVAPHVPQQLGDLVVKCLAFARQQQQHANGAAALNERQCSSCRDAGRPRLCVPVGGSLIVHVVVTDAGLLRAKCRADESAALRSGFVNRQTRIQQVARAHAGGGDDMRNR